jgi:hypothetical protein
VANDFREEVRQETKARIPGSHRIAKGSFGPSFAAKEGKDAYQEDALDSEIVPGSDGGEQKKARKRGGSGEGERLRKRPKRVLGTASIPEGERPNTGPKTALGTATTTCPCCGQFHHLAKCWYVFPELAPESFMERDHLRIRVKEALLDPDLQEKVEKMRHQRESQS